MNGSLKPLGAPLTGDTLGTARLPTVARLQQDLRIASGVPGYLASIGQGAFNAHAEVRVTPFTAEFGLTDRLSFGVTLPLVRTAIRAHFDVAPTGASLGAEPARPVGGADGAYAGFFNQFNTAITGLSNNIAGGQYGCPSSPQCAQAQGFLAQAIAGARRAQPHGVRRGHHALAVRTALGLRRGRRHRQHRRAAATRAAKHLQRGGVQFGVSAVRRHGVGDGVRRRS